MLLITILPVLLSNVGTLDASILKEQMDESVNVHLPPTKAPPIPMWPEGLPDPILLQPGDRLTTPDPATCYPYPTDFVLDYHLLHWEAYPGKCQRKLNDCWAAFDDLTSEATRAVTALTSVMEDEPEEFSLKWLLTGIGAMLGGVAVGYVIGRYL